MTDDKSTDKKEEVDHKSASHHNFKIGVKFGEKDAEEDKKSAHHSDDDKNDK